MSTTMTADQALQWGSDALSAHSPSARLDALILLAFVLGCSKERVLSHGEVLLEPQLWTIFNALISRRARHEPIAYLIGSQEFWGLQFQVTPAVLIPRPETELLVELTLKTLAALPNDRTPRVLDMGTGSGCVACAVAHELRQREREVEIVALERSEAALDVARVNATRLGVSDVVSLQLCDWNQLRPALPFDVVVSNPPYIAESDLNRSPETEFEPREALFAGLHGLDAIESIVRLLPGFLTPTGQAFLEIGITQAQQVRRIESDAVRCVAVEADLSGRERVAVFQRTRES